MKLKPAIPWRAANGPHGWGAIHTWTIGFSPPALTVPTGATVEWTNTGLLTGSSVAATGSLQAVGANNLSWDSGEIASGDTFRLQFDEPGTYSYVNAENPSQEATIIVADSVDPGETEVKVFLPIANK